MPKTAEQPGARMKLVFREECGICTRRVPEDQLTVQRGVKVCWRKGCRDEYDPQAEMDD